MRRNLGGYRYAEINRNGVTMGDTIGGKAGFRAGLSMRDRPTAADDRPTAASMPSLSTFR